MNDTPENPGRWERDPSGRHEWRYWDGSQWTDHVADQGVQRVDPLPPYPGTERSGAGEPVGATPGSQAPPTHEPQPAFQSQPQPYPPYQPYGAVPPGWATGGDPTAVMGRRYGAFFIDLVISFLAVGILFVATAEQRTVGEALRLPDCQLDFGSDQVECDNRVVVTVNDTVYEATGASFAATFGWSFLYYAVLQGAVGATLGKLMTGIRVVRPDGATQGVGRGIVRWLVYFVDGPLTFYLCGIITTATSRGHRRLGDMAAKTYVVAQQAAGHPVTV